MPYEQRTYRSYSTTQGLVSFTSGIKETDLFISAQLDLSDQSRVAIDEVRVVLEDYIRQRPDFKTSLAPIAADPKAHAVIRAMLDAAQACGVGPMAAVAGSVAEYVGRVLL